MVSVCVLLNHTADAVCDVYDNRGISWDFGPCIDSSGDYVQDGTLYIWGSGAAAFGDNMVPIFMSLAMWATYGFAHITEMWCETNADREMLILSYNKRGHA